LPRAVRHEGLATVVAAHLSRQNNLPDLARRALGEAMGREPQYIPVADPVTGTDWIAV
jgi:hypothetical protein